MLNAGRIPRHLSIFSVPNTPHMALSMAGRRVLKIILAVLLGEITLILLTTVAQEVLFDGIDYHTSETIEIFLGGIATFLSAVVAGMVASWVVDGLSSIPPLVISLIILLETTYLIMKEVLTGPFWFDFLSAVFLVVGIWAGHYSYRTLRMDR